MWSPSLINWADISSVRGKRYRYRRAVYDLLSHLLLEMAVVIALPTSIIRKLRQRLTIGPHFALDLTVID